MTQRSTAAHTLSTAALSAADSCMSLTGRSRCCRRGRRPICGPTTSPKPSEYGVSPTTTIPTARRGIGAEASALKVTLPRACLADAVEDRRARDDVGRAALPRQRPAAGLVADVVGVRAGHVDVLAAAEREHVPAVLEQHLGLRRGAPGQRVVRGRADLADEPAVGERVLEQPVHRPAEREPAYATARFLSASADRWTARVWSRTATSPRFASLAPGRLGVRGSDAQRQKGGRYG